MTDTRHDQRFPTLAPEDIERVARIGRRRSFAAGEHLFRIGETGIGLFVLTDERVESCGVMRDPKGFVAIGPGDLTTDHLGVFAIGDVRSGSVKRVGEGAAIIAEIQVRQAEQAA